MDVDSDESDLDFDDPQGPTLLVPRGAEHQSPVPPELLDRPPDDFATLMSELKTLVEPGVGEDTLLLMQLPSVLPIPVPASPHIAANGDVADHKDAIDLTAAVGAVDGRPAALSELPPTKLGKLLMLKSGRVKLRIGDVLFDVSPGINCRTRQELAVVDTAKKECTVLGSVGQRVVVTPDLETLLSDGPLPEWKAAAPGSKPLRANGRVLLDSDDEENAEAGIGDVEVKDEEDPMDIDEAPKARRRGGGTAAKAKKR